jgi:hypothetical protein
MNNMRKKDFKYLVGKRYDGMMGRCYRESDRSYKSYGAKGIRVAESWIRDINCFTLWLIEELKNVEITIEEFTKNSRSIQLDRIDPRGHYTPINCRLVSPQANNRNRILNKGKTIVSAEGTIVKFGD